MPDTTSTRVRLNRVTEQLLNQATTSWFHPFLASKQTKCGRTAWARTSADRNEDKLKFWLILRCLRTIVAYKIDTNNIQSALRSRSLTVYFPLNQSDAMPLPSAGNPDAARSPYFLIQSSAGYFLRVAQSSCWSGSIQPASPTCCTCAVEGVNSLCFLFRC